MTNTAPILITCDGQPTCGVDGLSIAPLTVVCPLFGNECNGPLLEPMAKRYGLTTSEVRVLEALLKVDGVRAVAERLGLSQATVKTHLHRLFRKTGAKRQSDLVKRVVGL